MAILECIFEHTKQTYTLNFKSKNDSFDANFQITSPEGFQYKQVKCYDGFIFAVIFAAMKAGENLHTELPISCTGLKNLNYFIEAWNNLLPNQYKKIRITTSNEVKNYIPQPNKEVISAFSGGVDACFTLIRHNEKDWGESSFNIKNVLCVQGFDVPTDKYKEYDLLMNRVSPIFKQYNCQNFKVWTDIREKSGQDWEMSFSSQLAACIHLFSEHFNQALIGSSEPYSDFFVPWGSTPATDYLLSSDAMTLNHDGAGYSRTEKVERISKNSFAQDLVKVCWQGGFEENCGKCEKCYRTRMNFIAVGVSDPKCFHTPINLDAFKKIQYRSNASIVELESILSYAERKGIQQKWVETLRSKIKLSRLFYHAPFFNFLRRMKRTFF